MWNLRVGSIKKVHKVDLKGGGESVVGCVVTRGEQLTNIGNLIYRLRLVFPCSGRRGNGEKW